MDCDVTHNLYIENYYLHHYRRCFHILAGSPILKQRETKDTPQLFLKYYRTKQAAPGG